MAPTARIAETARYNLRSFLLQPQQGRTAMPQPQMNTDELAELLTQLELSTEDSRDELLTDFLVRPYPTKGTQDN
jgi:hypothetical protein